jgi:serine/threonine-protein kinase HipA
MGYPALALLLRRAGVAKGDANAQDAAELFRRMVFNILVDNTDDHEKNHSLLAVSPWENGRFRLAPAYDVLPSNSGDFGHDSTLDNAMSRCQSFGLSSRGRTSSGADHHRSGHLEGALRRLRGLTWRHRAA